MTITKELYSVLISEDETGDTRSRQNENAILARRFNEKSYETRPLWRSMRSWGYNITINLKVIWREDVQWIHQVHDRAQRPVPVKTLKNIRAT